MAICEEYVSIPVPLTLKADLRRLAERDTSTLASTARRILVRGIKRELADETPETSAAKEGGRRG